jgi:SAM-dependent methyltransferase
MKPLALDLCCGAGGWTDGLLAAGFSVIGVDIVRRPEYRGRLVLSNVLDVEATVAVIQRAARGRRIRVVVKSPPCQRFSLARAGRVADPATAADLAILHALRAIVARLRELGHAIAYDLTENVRGAKPWFTPILGKPAVVHGAFYIWGNAPAFLVERSGLKKGIYGSKSPTTARLGRQTKPKDPWLSARLPIELTRPLAFALRGNLEDSA